jgi:hypothetical protein
MERQEEIRIRVIESVGIPHTELKNRSFHRSISGGRIRQRFAGEECEESREDAVADSPYKWYPRSPVDQKSRADDEVGFGLFQLRHEIRQKGRRMLPVAIQLYDVLVAILNGIFVAGLKSGTHPKVERMGHNEGTGLTTHTCRSIGRSVIHDKNCCLRKEVADPQNHFSDALFLIEGGDQYKDVFFRDHDGFV